MAKYHNLTQTKKKKKKHKDKGILYSIHIPEHSFWIGWMAETDTELKQQWWTQSPKTQHVIILTLFTLRLQDGRSNPWSQNTITITIKIIANLVWKKKFEDQRMRSKPISSWRRVGFAKIGRSTSRGCQQGKRQIQKQSRRLPSLKGGGFCKIF